MTSLPLARPLPTPAATAATAEAPGPRTGRATAALQASLLAALPAATRVLGLGAGAAALGAAYGSAHADARWVAMEWHDAGLVAAAAAAELVVVADGFAGIGDAAAALRALAGACDAGAALFVALRNGASLEALIRLVEADLSEADVGVDADADAAGPAPARGFASPAAACKSLMDAGWMPQIVARTAAPAEADDDAPEPAVAGAALALAEALRIPRATAAERLGLQGYVLEARRPFEALPAARAAEPARFSVVVPTTRERQLRRDVVASPGLRELGAAIVPVRGAHSAAAALERALAEVETEWVLLCHQDVWFPAGFGTRLNAVLEAIPAGQRALTLIGFAGMGVDAARQGYAPAGFVIDRLQRFDHAASATAVSIDELAIVVARESLHRIDPALGWHLWATDLCLTAIGSHRVFPRIVRLPLFHDSVNDYTLPAAFHASAARLAAKHPGFGPIPTLCGTIAAAAPAPATAPTPTPAPAPAPAAATAITTDMSPASSPSANRCCLCGTAVEAWLPHPRLGRRSELMKLLDALGSDLSVYQCPGCGSNDRERHLWLYLSALQLPQRFAALRILHVAPEPAIEAIVLQLGPRDYVRGDLHPQQPGHVVLDVEALGFADARFDLVLCNHVLEHVARPERALAELHRVLAPGGTLVAQTPYAPALLHTLELGRPVSAAFATLFYGQADHLRLFGADIADRIRAAGFGGGLVPHDELLPAIDARAHGVNGREPFFCFTR